MSKHKKQLFKDRIQRVNDAINLKEPDRVPLTPQMNPFFISNQAGLSQKEVWYSGRKNLLATIKICKRYDWDLYPGVSQNGFGHFYDVLGIQNFKWPGAKDPNSRLPDNRPFQAVEGEWMKQDEYDECLDDPTGFFLRKIVAKQNVGLSAFSKFPGLDKFAFMGSGMDLGLFLIDKDFLKMVRKVNLSKLKLLPYLLTLGPYKKKMESLGFPLGGMGGGLYMASFDRISDSVRGMRGTMLDMYRRPDELKRLCDILAKATLRSIDSGKSIYESDDSEGVPRLCFIPLHRGANGFMNNKQFEEFYWPSLTMMMEGMIEREIIPVPFFEGCYSDRLEYLAEFAKKHKGKMVYWFHDIDMKQVKEMMGQYVCIRGNVPASLLVAGTPQQVEEYVRQNIEDCSEGGGYLIDGAIAGIPDEARHENVLAMENAVKKYGYYRK
ncbi:MAG: hypothetical protein JW776_14175 [Candidatus Lokiarchaeota archaeon]|nr:hypothetical protein [Candidatus Lokiarchaeota archaeon]